MIYCLTTLWFLLGLISHVVKEQEKLPVFIVVTGVQKQKPGNE